MDVNIFANKLWPPPNTYSNEVRYMRDFLVRRIAWMDAQFAPP